MRRTITFIVAAGIVACGSSSSGSDGSGDASADGAKGADAGAGGGGGGGGGGDGGQNRDASSDANGGGDGALGSQCHCDPATQYCLHGDFSVQDGANVERCVARIGDCFDCSCYRQIGLCFELALPKACTTIGSLIVVECAEIP